MKRGVGVVVIGNEVLTAKVEDKNGPLVLRRLRESGVAVPIVLTVTDDVPEIVQALHYVADKAERVITSGGIGPTHDDVTVRAVAESLGRAVERAPELEALVRAYYGENCPPEAFRLAEAPAGSRLVRAAGVRFPVVACEHVYMLPGIPELFRKQLEAVIPELPRAPVALASIYVTATEPEIAAALDRVSAANPDVAIGSYPTIDSTRDFRVKLTVEHAQADRVVEVVSALRREIPAAAVVRLEGP